MSPASRLAPVYLDDEPVLLADDPRPQVAQVLAASGRSPASVQVRRLDSHEGHDSRQLALEEYLDRAAEPTRPIYLTTQAVAPMPSEAPADAGLMADAGLNGPARFAGERASGAFGQGPETVTSKPATAAGTAPSSPGVSGEGNARGSLQSAYSRTGTDTAEPGMAAVDLNGPFGREGLAGKQGRGPQDLIGKGGVRRGPGTHLEETDPGPHVVAGHADEAPAATATEAGEDRLEGRPPKSPDGAAQDGQ